jgi:hypothetical protein
VTASRTIEKLLVKAGDGAFSHHALNLALRVSVVDDLLVLALNVIRLNPLCPRLDIGGFGAEKYFRCLRLPGLLAAEI